MNKQCWGFSYMLKPKTEADNADILWYYAKTKFIVLLYFLQSAKEDTLNWQGAWKLPVGRLWTLHDNTISAVDVGYHVNFAHYWIMTISY